jgi:hypothetical protein
LLWTERDRDMVDIVFDVVVDVDDIDPTEENDCLY